MLQGLLRFCLSRRPLALITFFAFLGLGYMAFRTLNIEAYPDPAPPIIEIIAQWPGQSPEEVERYVTVPIEIGWIGFLKYVVKRFVFRYDLPLLCSDRQYAAALLKGERISRFRPPAPGYGTHFGFDYRDVDEILARKAQARVESWNSGTARFYFIGGA